MNTAVRDVMTTRVVSAWPGSSAEPTCFPPSAARRAQYAAGPSQLPAGLMPELLRNGR
jgi:hypothetical protein